MAHVQTVLGPVPPQDLQRVLTHEHLMALVPGPWLSGGARDQRVELAAGALSGLHELGFGTVVDLTPYDVLGRDVSALVEISRRTGLHVVAASSIYLEPYAPSWALDASLDELTARLVRDAEEGIGDTGVKIGIYGEQATGLGVISAQEEKFLRAAARAHRRTGLSLNTHTTHGTMALEQIAILREEGADLSRVVIGHMDIQPDLAYVREVLASGVNIAFDTFGKQFWDFVLEPPSSNPPAGESAKRAYHRPDAIRLDEVVQLVHEGYSDRIVMSMDLTGKETYDNPTTQGRDGYSFLGAQVVPRLAELGVRAEALEQMLVTTPARLLTID
jgi:phosphotriesterase-related protein